MAWHFHCKATAIVFCACIATFCWAGTSHIEIMVGAKKLNVELANTPALRANGLMYRKTIPEDSGMLFAFTDETKRVFWMRNTYVSLSIGFFGSDLILNEIFDMAATTPETSIFLKYPSQKKAKYALEMPMGWFARNKIFAGAKLKFLSSVPASL